MASVTQRIRNIIQPRNGYLPISMFERIELNNASKTLSTEENIHASIVGTVVDYLTRFMLTNDAKFAFSISLKGARVAGKQAYADSVLQKIKGLDDNSIRAACMLVRYDIFARNRIAAKQYFTKDSDDADKQTICNIRKMVESTLHFFEKYGTVVSIGITFENGYTDVIDSGDADFLTSDTLWDLKVVKKERPSSNETLQLLVYYIMGLHSSKREAFAKLQYIGFFNPRLNLVYRCSVDKIAKEVIETVERNVIGYMTDSNEDAVDERAILYSKIKNGEALNKKQVCVLLKATTKYVDLLARTKWIESSVKGNRRMFAAEELLKWCDEEKKHFTVEEWKREGAKRFGEDMYNWKFKCPHCNRIYAVSECPRKKDKADDTYVAGRRCVEWYNALKQWDDDSCKYQYFHISDKVDLAKGGVVIEDEDMVFHIFDFAD